MGEVGRYLTPSKYSNARSVYLIFGVYRKLSGPWLTENFDRTGPYITLRSDAVASRLANGGAAFIENCVGIS